MNMGTWMVAPLSSDEARLGIGNLEFDEHLRLETDELIARIQQRDFVVLLEPL